MIKLKKNDICVIIKENTFFTLPGSIILVGRIWKKVKDCPVCGIYNDYEHWNPFNYCELEKIGELYD